jgi:hypothetical protein
MLRAAFQLAAAALPVAAHSLKGAEASRLRGCIVACCCGRWRREVQQAIVRGVQLPPLCAFCVHCHTLPAPALHVVGLRGCTRAVPLCTLSRYCSSACYSTWPGARVCCMALHCCLPAGLWGGVAQTSATHAGRAVINRRQSSRGDSRCTSAARLV